jgi:hypothetical protein
MSSPPASVDVRGRHDDDGDDDDEVAREATNKLRKITIAFPTTNQESKPIENIDDDDNNDDDDEISAFQPTKNDANSIDDLHRNVDKIRGYNELLDTYSLHQFIIHKGKTMRETPEFLSFKRVGHEIWGSIEQVIRALEQLLTRYFVPLAYIDGQQLMAVAAMELAVPSRSQLLACIVNEDQVADRGDRDNGIKEKTANDALQSRSSLFFACFITACGSGACETMAAVPCSSRRIGARLRVKKRSVRNSKPSARRVS